MAWSPLNGHQQKILAELTCRIIGNRSILNNIFFKMSIQTTVIVFSYIFS